MHEAGNDNPGTMAAVLGLDDDQVEVACRRADSDVWVANFNAPGQVVIAGSPEGVAAASAVAKELGAKKVMPLQVSGAFHTPFMTPARDRLRKAIAEANPRDTEVPVVSNVDALAHDTGAEWTQPAVGPAQQPGALEALPAHARVELGVTDFVELGPGGVLTGMAKRTVDGARTISVATPEELDKLLEWVHAGSPRRVGPSTRASTCSPSSGSWSARPPACSTPVGGLRDGTRIEVGTVLGHVGDTEVRSAFAGVLQSYIACRRRAGHAPPTHRLAEDGLTCLPVPPSVRGAVITGWGTALPPKVLTNHDLEQMIDTCTTGSSSAPASTSATSAAPPSACRSRAAARRSTCRASTRRHRRARARHHHARPDRARQLAPPCSTSSACAAARST